MTFRPISVVASVGMLVLLTACAQDTTLPSAPGEAAFAKTPSTGFAVYVTGKGPDVSTTGGNRAVYVAGGGTDDAATWLRPMRMWPVVVGADEKSWPANASAEVGTP